jgi:hypothetical protein
MAQFKGLPAFFQTNAKTVVAGLEDFELDGNGSGNTLDSLIGDGEEDGLNNDTFGDAEVLEYDENPENLPDFFKMNKPITTAPPPAVIPAMTAKKLDLPGSGSRAPPGLPPGLTPQKAPLTTGTSTSSTPSNAYFSSPASFLSPSVPVFANVPPAPPSTATAGPPPGINVSQASSAALFGAIGGSQPKSNSLSFAAAAGSSQGTQPTLTPRSLFPPESSSQPTHPVTPQRDLFAATSTATPSTLFPGTPSLSSVTQALPETPTQPVHYRVTEYLGRGKYMSAGDVRYVVSRVLQPLETVDPYADDFYNIQFKLRKNRKEREAAAREGAEAPAPPAVPVPTWKETKERIKLQMEATRRNFTAKVKDWEEKEQVLGHRIRAEVSKPKELLSIPNLNDLELDLIDNPDSDNILLSTDWKSPFNSRLWSTRAAVQQGYEALFTVQELQQLAQFPSVAQNQSAMEEIKREIESAINLLSQSLGIRTLIHASPNHFGGGGASSSTPNATGVHSSSGRDLSILGNANEYTLDGRHVSAILQTVIGKKLLIRGIKFLSPQHRWALIPVILARILLPSSTPAVVANAAAGDNKATAASILQEMQEVERKLIATMNDYLNFCFAQHRDLHAKVMPGVAAATLYANNYSRELLGHLRQCLKNIMITQMDKKSQLRESLLVERARAEVLYVIVRMGDQILGTWSDAQAKVEWVQTREAFMSLLEG